MKFRIYRYDPAKDSAPYMKDYEVALDPHDRMLLDAMIRLKEVDDTLAFRRSCREGVCGSDAMNINGKNGLACVTRISDLPEHVTLRPLPGLPVIRDLIVDMTQFFKQYHSIKPYVVNHEPAPERVREAIRDVVSHCIYGVDRNPLAVSNATANRYALANIHTQTLT